MARLKSCGGTRGSQLEDFDEVSPAVEICKLRCTSAAALQRAKQNDAGSLMFSVMYEVKGARQLVPALQTEQTAAC